MLPCINASVQLTQRRTSRSNYLSTLDSFVLLVFRKTESNLESPLKILPTLMRTQAGLLEKPGCVWTASLCANHCSVSQARNKEMLLYVNDKSIRWSVFCKDMQTLSRRSTRFCYHIKTVQCDYDLLFDNHKNRQYSSFWSISFWECFFFFFSVQICQTLTPPGD